MDAILQVLTEAIAPVNAPFTVLMILVLGYWLLVMLGCLSAEESGDAHVELDGSDAHLDLNGGEAHVDLDGGDAHVEMDSGSGELHGHPVGGSTQALQPLLRFLHVGDVPLMPLLSLLALSMWLLALLGNHYLNPTGRWSLGLLIAVANLGLSAVILHFVAKPLKGMFRAMNQDADEQVKIIGSICQVTTGEVTPEFGEGMLTTKGAPLLLHIRTTGGEVLRRGESALVIAEAPRKGLYTVTRFKPLKILEETVCL